MLEKIAGYIKAAAKAPTGYIMAAMVVLWLSRDWEDGKPYVRGALLVACIAALGRSAEWLLAWLREKKSVAKARRIVDKRFEALPVAEKEIIRLYFDRDAKTLVLDVGHPVVAQLVREGVLVIVSNIRAFDTVRTGDPFALPLPVMIQPPIWEYLKEHRHLLGP